MSNGSEFGAQLRRFAEKTGNKLENVDRAFKLGLLERLVRGTRVADPMTWKRPDPDYRGGTMRGNWQVTQGAPAQAQIARLNTGLAVPPEEQAKIQPFAKTYLTNTTDYFAVWNEVDGTIPRAVASASAALAEAVRETGN